jgi:hypothetical protein
VTVLLTKNHAHALDLETNKTVWVTPVSGAVGVPTMSSTG